MSDFVNTATEMGAQAALDALTAHTLTELKEDGVRTIAANALYANTGLERVEFPIATEVGANAMYSCSNLQSVKLPLCTSIGAAAFQNDTILREVYVPECKSIGNNAFQNVRIPKLEFPKATSIGSNIARWYGCSELDFSAKLNTIPASAFNEATNLTSLILRSSEMISLSNVNAFNGTPIKNGYGWIYVPANLVDTYKSATNWSTYAACITSIDTYPRELQCTITDSWEQIFAAEEDGSYATKYSVGDTKFVDIDGIPFLMQIVGMDVDDLADDSGKAKITWLSNGNYEERVLNSTASNYLGWGGCELRTYLQGTFLQKIDPYVRSKIKLVKKVYKANTRPPTQSGYKIEQLEINDTIWVPSNRELGASYYSETVGPIYSGVFTNDASRKKFPNCAAAYGDYDYRIYWTRNTSSSGATQVMTITRDGTVNNYSGPSVATCVVFGFCT